MTYFQKLKDPRWQKKRLAILNRDEFECCLCGATRSELHVHHREYFKDPWECPDSSLITLCAGCHDRIENIVTRVRKLADFEPALCALEQLLEGHEQWASEHRSVLDR